MTNEVKLVFWAGGISFLGSLPLGILNLSVAGYMSRHDHASAIRFSVAAILVEIIIVRAALMAVRRLEVLKHYFRLLSLLTCMVLLVLSFTMLAAAYKMRQFQPTLPFTEMNPVLSGLLLSVINPLHLPFWMGWTAVLKSKKVLDDRPMSYNRFVIAIGSGTALAFALYGFAGGYLIGILGRQQTLLNWIVGLVLLITAIILLHRTFSGSGRSKVEENHDTRKNGVCNSRALHS